MDGTLIDSAEYHWITWHDGSANESGFLVERLVDTGAGPAAAAAPPVGRTFFVDANTTSFTETIVHF